MSIPLQLGVNSKVASTSVFATHITLGVEVDNGSTTNTPSFYGVGGNTFQFYLYDGSGTLLATFNDYGAYGRLGASASNPQSVTGNDGNMYTVTWQDTGSTTETPSPAWGFHVDVAGLTFGTPYQFQVGNQAQGWLTMPKLTLWTAPVWITEAYLEDVGGGNFKLNVQFYLAPYFWGIANDVTGSTGDAFLLNVYDVSNGDVPTLATVHGGSLGRDLSALAAPIAYTGSDALALGSIPYTTDALEVDVQWNPASSTPYTDGTADNDANVQTANLFACLGAGTRLTLADGTTKAIEDVVVGDTLASLGGTTCVVTRTVACDVGVQDVFVIPRDTYGATDDLTLSRQHGFWASEDEYASGAPPRTANDDDACIAWTAPTASALSPSASAAVTTPVPRRRTLYNVGISGGVMIANGVLVVGM